jgi:hypothetical protein
VPPYLPSLPLLPLTSLLPRVVISFGYSYAWCNALTVAVFIAASLVILYASSLKNNKNGLKGLPSPGTAAATKGQASVCRRRASLGERVRGCGLWGRSVVERGLASLPDSTLWYTIPLCTVAVVMVGSHLILHEVAYHDLDALTLGKCTHHGASVGAMVSDFMATPVRIFDYHTLLLLQQWLPVSEPWSRTG